jgi:hypothetical protein
MGLQRIHDENGKTLIQMSAVSAETMTNEQLVSEMKKEAASKEGTYRPVYPLSDIDLSPEVINTIAGEALNNKESIDGVINNMLNRVGAEKNWGNLRDVARSPGQYEGYRNASDEQAEFIRSRIKEIASGKVPSNIGAATEFRAQYYVMGEGYGKTFEREARKQGYLQPGPNDNIYAETFPAGPYAPRKAEEVEKIKTENAAKINKSYTPEEIAEFKRLLIEKQQSEAKNKLIKELYNRPSMTSSSAAVIDKEFKFTDKLGNLTPNLRTFDPNIDDPGKSSPGEFNYSLSQEGMQRFNLVDKNGKITPASVEKNLVEIETNSGVKVKIHKDIAENTRAFLNELEARGYPVRPDTAGYSYRGKNGGAGTGLSTHATGTTFDVNYQTNWGTMEGGNGKIDMPPDIEKLANYYGFSWGARFGDPMHFETMSPELHQEKLKQLQNEGYIEKKEEKEVETAVAQPEIPTPQKALGGNVYGLNEDLTLVETNTGNPVAQVNENEKLIKQGSMMQVTPETKIVAEQLSDNTSVNTTDAEEPQTSPEPTKLNKQVELPPQRETDNMWRESINATAYDPSPSYQRAMNKAKYQNTERESRSWSRAKVS